MLRIGKNSQFTFPPKTEVCFISCIIVPSLLAAFSSSQRFHFSFPFIVRPLSLWQPSELHCYNRKVKFPMWNGQWSWEGVGRTDGRTDRQTGQTGRQTC